MTTLEGRTQAARSIMHRRHMIAMTSEIFGDERAQLNVVIDHENGVTALGHRLVLKVSHQDLDDEPPATLYKPELAQALIRS